MNIHHHYYMGIDLGTSGVKLLLIDSGQRVVATATSQLEVSHPHPGWSEQNPDDWIEATKTALQHIRNSNPEELAQLKGGSGIGMSGQMHGATLLDAHNRPLRPCILWNDTRAHAEAAAMNASDAQFAQITGNLVFPGFTAPKLAWIRQNEPELFARIAKVLLPKDYLRFWLTGEYCTDMADAAGTSWLDVRERCWSEPLLAATGLSIAQMPRLVEGTQPAGMVRPEILHSHFGINSMSVVVVAGGAGDNAAAACGVGAIQSQTAFLSIGTSGVLFTATDECRPNPATGVHTFCHALPKMWCQMGVSLCATDSLNWFSQVTGIDACELVAELGEQLRAPTALTFLPYLSGERCPHNDAHIRGCFVGLSHQSDRRGMTQAILEGVAFAFRDILGTLMDGQQSARKTVQTLAASHNSNNTTLSSTSSSPPFSPTFKQLIAIGGGSRSEYWLKVIATVLGITVSVPAAEWSANAAAFGAARLALIASMCATNDLNALTANASWLLTVCTPPAIGKQIVPNAELAPAFEAAYTRYRSMYPAIKNATTDS